MKNISILLADDDHNIRNTIEKILIQNFVSMKIIAKTDSVENTITALNKYKPDVAILDIHLIGGTSIEVLKKTAHLNYKVIFMSAYQEYALDDIRFASIDFIYKPLDISELLITVDNVITTLLEEGYKKKMQTLFSNTNNLSKNKYIIFKTKSQIISVHISDIIYGESHYSLSNFELNSGQQINIKEPLRRYESMLQSYNFFRCHPLYIVNIDHIINIDYSAGKLILTNNLTIPFEERRLELISTNYHDQNIAELEELNYKSIQNR